MAGTCKEILWILFMWGLCQSNGVASKVIQKVFRKGGDIELTCPSEINENFTWWFEGKPLHNNTVHTNNGTTVLKISNVGIKNQGTYSCGSSWQQGINVTVLIGDLPSPPRHIYTYSLELDISLHWMSSESTGGLNVTYTVVLDCLTDCDNSKVGGILYVPPIVAECNGMPHINDKKYSCDLRSATLYSKFKATVYAVNTLGNSSASIIFQRPNAVDPSGIFPGPVLNLTAKEILTGTVRLSWKKANVGAVLQDMLVYKITYKKDGDNKTFTEITNDKETTTVIENLLADSTYHFYMRRQYRSLNISSHLSSPTVTSLHTRYKSPSQPPQNVRCSTFGNQKMINLSWMPPSKQYQNGPLKLYKINYYKIGSANSTVMAVNASQTHANLTNINTSKRIYVTACNKAGCSGISDGCYFKETPKQQIPEGGTYSNTTLIAVGSVTGIIFAVIFIILFVCCRVNRKKTPKDILLPVIERPDYHEHYDDPSSPQEEEYDKPYF